MSSLSSLNQQLQAKKSELTTNTSRLKQVQDILSYLNNKFNDDIQDINGRIDSVVTYSENGFDGFSHIQTVDNKIKGSKEQDIASDSELAQTKSNLEKEIEAVKNKIETLKTEIVNLVIAIAEEEERLRREAEQKSKESKGSN